MSCIVRDLHPGALYITISVPSLPPASYPPRIPKDFDPNEYETSNFEGHEEFDWGVYLHRGPGDGIWYILHPEPHPEWTFARPRYTFEVRSTRTSPRLDPSVVGLVRILHVPDYLMHGFAGYLAGVAAHKSINVHRSFIWATTVYLRARMDLEESPYSVTQDVTSDFDAERFLCETLVFAYGEVLFALGGQLPRPILMSQFGVDVRSLDDDEQVNSKGKTVERRTATDDMLLRKLKKDTGGVVVDHEDFPPLP